MAKHSEVFNTFMNMFGHMLCKPNAVESYFPCGFNAIRLRLNNGTEYVFTYNDVNDWQFETIDSFLKKLSEKRKPID